MPSGGACGHHAERVPKIADAGHDATVTPYGDPHPSHETSDLIARLHPGVPPESVVSKFLTPDAAVLAARLFWPPLRVDDAGFAFESDDWDVHVHRSGSVVDEIISEKSSDPAFEPGSVAFVPLEPLLGEELDQAVAEWLSKLLLRTWTERLHDGDYDPRSRPGRFSRHTTPTGEVGITYSRSFNSVIFRTGEAEGPTGSVSISFCDPPTDFPGGLATNDAVVLGRLHGWDMHLGDPDEAHDPEKSALFRIADIAAFGKELRDALDAGEGLAWLSSYPSSDQPSVHFPDEDRCGGGSSSGSGYAIDGATVPSITSPSGFTLAMLLRPSGRVLIKHHWTHGSSSGDMSDTSTAGQIKRLLVQIEDVLNAFPADEAIPSPRPRFTIGGDADGRRHPQIESGKVWPSLDEDAPVLGEA